MTQLPVGGPAATTYRVTSRAHVTGRVAVPAYLVTDGRAVEGGPSQQVYYVSDAEIAAGEFVVAGDVHPIPIVVVNNINAEYPPIPIYVVNPPLVAPAQSSLLTGLSAYWMLQEASGNSRADSVGASTLLETGGAIGTGAGPGAPLSLGAKFVTSRTLSCVSNADIRHGNNDFTIAGWIYFPSGQIVGALEKGIAGATEYGLRYISGALNFYCGTSSVSIASGVPGNTWLFVRAWRVASENKIYLRYNEANEVSGACATAGDSTNPFNLGSFSPGGNFFNNGRISGLGFWKRVLIASEVAILAAGGAAGVYPFDSIPTVQVRLDTPVSYQVEQGTTITLTGSVLHANSDVEASFNGGAYADVATNQRGTFTGSLTSQSIGQGSLTLRSKSSGHTSIKTLVGLGDVFVIAGQSNASGRGTNNQAYSHATLKATLYGNDYTWKELADPSDSASGQIDTVSSDSSPAAAGSIWPLVATSYMAARSAPCAFVPCAKGGTKITAWLPGANHQDRTTLYGSMVYRALQTGCKAILWWQGEQDAFDAMDTATYQGHMDTIVTALATDLPGVKFAPAKLHLGNTYSDANAAQIQTAIANIWAGGYGNVVAGADLSSLRSDSGDHFTANVSLSTVAAAWWSALQAAFGW